MYRAVAGRDGGVRAFLSRGKFQEAKMSAYEMFVLAIAGANGGMIYYALRRREQMLARVKARSRRR
jgi:hypothetical protein